MKHRRFIISYVNICFCFYRK